MARVVTVGGTAMPSRATIAPPQRLLPAAVAMAITRGERDNPRTQHRPKRVAWTGAPCHTPPALPPGSATSGDWKLVPVGCQPEHEDENGHATAALRVASVGAGVPIVTVRRWKEVPE